MTPARLYFHAAGNGLEIFASIGNHNIFWTCKAVIVVRWLHLSPSHHPCCAWVQEIAGLRMDAEGGLHADGTEQQVVAQGGWRNKIADPLIAGLSIPQMRTWNYSAGLWQFHHHYQVSLQLLASCHCAALKLRQQEFEGSCKASA